VRGHTRPQKVAPMLDALFIAAIVLSLAVCIAYLIACERL
jgi:multisubunit Na+/H+ antiporter MnhC subunit